MAILDIKDLYTTFKTDDGLVRAVNGLDISLAQGEILGIVGESGSGKSTVGRALLRLLDPSSGSIRLEGRLGSASYDREGDRLLAEGLYVDLPAWNPSGTESVGNGIIKTGLNALKKRYGRR